MKKIDLQLEKRFICTKCKHKGASSKRIATTGAGISRFIDIQHNTFIALSCNYCGYTEIYNPRVMEGSDGTVMNLIDIIFGLD
jgi:uncharacterized protein